MRIARSLLAGVAALVLTAASLLSADAPLLEPGSGRDGQRDFDFHIGSWKTHLRRLQKPLTGSTTWVEYDGTTEVRKVWNGAANLVELDVRAPPAASKA